MVAFDPDSVPLVKKTVSSDFCFTPLEEILLPLKFYYSKGVPLLPFGKILYLDHLVPSVRLI